MFAKSPIPRLNTRVLLPRKAISVSTLGLEACNPICLSPHKSPLIGSEIICFVFLTTSNNALLPRVKNPPRNAPSSNGVPSLENPFHFLPISRIICGFLYDFKPFGSSP